MRPSASAARSSWRAAAWRARSPRLELLVGGLPPRLGQLAHARRPGARGARPRRGAARRARCVLGGLRRSPGPRGVVLELLAVALGLRAQALALALALDAALRGPARRPHRDGDDDEDDDDDEAVMPGPTRARGAEPVASLRSVPPVNDLPLIASGKVREMYDLGDRILMVASDRISTYDVVHPTPIPDKGKVLTGLSAFWFHAPATSSRNHFVSATEACPTTSAAARWPCASSTCCPSSAWCAATSPARAGRTTRPPARSRASSCRPACASPSACRRRSSRPSTKADEGHDEAIDFDRAAELVGDRDLMAPRARRLDLALRFAAEHARERGVILADTKFEFGLDDDGELVVGDEVLTPDSSRYWPADGYEPGPAAELRQAVRARLGLVQRLGQGAAGAGAPRRRRRRARASATSRPTS